MKTKTKLSIGLGILLLLIALLATIGSYRLHSLAQDTRHILEDNHKTLEFSRNMLLALEQGPADAKAMQDFYANLVQQEANVTEQGEQVLTDQLRKDFEAYKRDSSAAHDIRAGLYGIMGLNMDAIVRKSQVAESTASDSIVWISIASALCFVIGLTLWINLPGYVANPIKELNESIKQIAAKNYAHRLYPKWEGEFAELAQSFNRMANQLEEYNRSNVAKLMMEKMRIEALVNNMHDPVLGLDEQDKFIFANPAALRICGLRSEDLLGKSAPEIASRNDLVRILTADVQAGKQSQGPSSPLKIFADDKESYFEKETLHISIVPTGEQEPKAVGHVIILRNVTPHKELDFAKTNFIATVSHELKTPISSIKMCLQLLENQQIGPLNAEQNQLIDSIREDAGRLLRITGELLHMTQVESGQIQLSILPADPLHILNYAIQTNKVAAEQKQLMFETSCPADIPLVLADSEKTAWVLTNLISNAIRYSPPKATIYLSIRQNAEQVLFSIRDTGQGIAPQYQQKVFERYFRVPGSAKEGTGLGLAISKEFIEAQGGDISLQSEFGSGSTFTVSLKKAGLEL